MWGVSQDRIKKGRAREGWDVPKANSKGMAKWGLGPRDLPTQASVSILDLELPQGHISSCRCFSKLNQQQVGAGP